MPTVRILSRSLLPRAGVGGGLETQAAITYQTELAPPRTVYLPADLYISDPDVPPTPGGFAVVKPKDDGAQSAEDDAIRADLAALQASPSITREL